MRSDNIKDADKRLKRDKPKSPFKVYCITTVSLILIFCSVFVLLFFQTDVFYSEQSKYLTGIRFVSNTSVESVIKELANREEEAELPPGEDPGSGGEDPNLPGGGGGSYTPGAPIEGDVLDFTAGGNFECPYNSFCYTFMGWQLVTSSSSNQYIWRAKYYPTWVWRDTDGDGNNDTITPDPTAFDSEGFGICNGRYVIAVSDARDGGIGTVGQELDVYIDNNADGKEDIVLQCVVGDIKSSGDADWSKWGHIKSGTSANTIEFIVDKDSWYGKKPNPGNASNHPEWKGTVLKIVRGNIT